MQENQLTRRKFMSITATGTLIILLDSCDGGSSKPISKSTPSPKFSSSLPEISPGSITPAGLGVNIHFTEPRQGDIQMIANGGLGFVRLDFTWSEIERQQGKYDFSVQEKLIEALGEHGIRVLAILDYSNRLYDKSSEPLQTGPHTDEMRQAFARFAGAAASTFKGRGVIWEIWNEPNNPDFWKPKPNADEYVKLAKDTIKAMRQADADVGIIAPGITTFPLKLDVWNFLERCFELGLLEQIDGVSIHPYRAKPPETVDVDYQRLRTLMAQYMPKSKKSIPIISSEWGYPIETAVSLELQAALLVRQFLINSMKEIPLSIWYDWQDGKNTQNPLYNFGLVTWDDQPKPAYLGVKTLTSQLKGFRFIKRLPLSSGGDFALLFASGQMQKLVLWTVDNPHSVRLPVDAPATEVVSMIGETKSLNATDGVLVIDLTSNPQYLLTVI
jgi:polysaccharide biosynthesis protein PslG